MRRAREWDRTVLTVQWWDSELPVPGDGLETSTGRRYLIFGLKFGRETRTVTQGEHGPIVTYKRGPLRALECVVLPKGEPIDGRIFDWAWAPRVSKRRAR